VPQLRRPVMPRALLALLLAMLAMAATALPAAATVHEITGMFCAGEHGNHFPAGLSGGSNADNFAKPLFATGFVESVTPFNDGVNGPGMLITFDFDHPASKLAPHPTLDTFFVGDGTYISAFVFEGGFTNCVLLRDS
jgi:hypothetical protein